VPAASIRTVLSRDRSAVSSSAIATDPPITTAAASIEDSSSGIGTADSAGAHGSTPDRICVSTNRIGAASVDAMTDLVVSNIGLVVAYDDAVVDPHADEIHAFWYRHISELLSEARPDVDADLLARLLLGALGGDLVRHLIQSGETARLEVGIRQLVDSVLHR
jgi:hypothetical protein